MSNNKYKKSNYIFPNYHDDTSNGNAMKNNNHCNNDNGQQ